MASLQTPAPPGHHLVASGELAQVTAAAAKAAERCAASSAGTGSQAGKGLLDGFVLLQAAHVEFPDRATKARLTDKGIDRVLEDDLLYFERLVHLDLGENQVGMEQLVNLRALEELRLPCNEIKTIPHWTLEHGDKVPFQALLVLDLSYNKLVPGALLPLSHLPRLRELDLTCNDLDHLPEEDLDGFAALEILFVANNGLRRDHDLVVLSRFPILRELDASDNRFRRVPEGVEFPRLEWLSLVNNCVSAQTDVEALLNGPALSQVLLYGNPISRRSECHPAREEKEQIHPVDAREQLVPLRAGGREGLPNVVNVVTDRPRDESAPQHRSALKSGKPRVRGMYTQFQITRVEEATMRKPSEWRAMGNRMLLGVSSEHAGADERGFLQLQEGSCSSPTNDRDENGERLDEEKQQQQQQTHQKQQENHESIFMTEPESLLESSFHSATNNNTDNSGEASPRNTGGGEPSEIVSSFCEMSTSELREELSKFSASGQIDHPQASNDLQAKKSVANATSALRYALKHPLTIPKDSGIGLAPAPFPQGAPAGEYWENLAEGSSFPQYLRPTKASRLRENAARVLAKESFARREAEELRRPAERPCRDKHKHRPSGMPRQQRSMLRSIETVLDKLNFDDQQGAALHAAGESKDGHTLDDTERTVDHLVGLVNNVMDSFEL
ncbi:X-ray radiation resistance-associated protein 1 [Durusdinium trenchii]|uniref:X-ray radiation resistance-associated protein 1 n=1 Tax=Durusdinium trenchii TaxID=1381693 RepID=A0ABP0HVT2_9DINO